MKSKYLLISLFLSLFMSATLLFAQEKNSYYYYNGEKFYIEIDYSTISIASEGESSLNKSLSSQQFGNVKYKKTDNSRKTVVSLNKKSQQKAAVFIEEVELKGKVTQKEYSELIQKLQKEENIIKASPSYIYDGKKMGVSNNFYVKLKNHNDVNLLSELTNQYSIEILGYNQLMPLWFTLSCTKNTPYNAVEAANIFYETNLFESCEPEFLLHNLLSSNDMYFNSQWGLKNTGQNGGTIGMDIKAEQAWLITTGSSNIKTFIFDEGFEMNHPDLVNNVSGTGFDTYTNTTPSIVWGSHGTACAGIVSAQQNNTIGVSGVAPTSELTSVSAFFDYGVTDQELANGFNWAYQNGADVISCSWGGGAPSNILSNAINNALTYGRSGKGCVIVFSTGNNNSSSVSYPANSNSLVLAVGAMSPCGERKRSSNDPQKVNWNAYPDPEGVSCDGEVKWGSNYGIHLDVMAPGVLVPTTDRQGAYGYVSGDYMLNFNGTSSACPHVAGVAALILSINPNLTVQQVSDIIEKTARKVGSYSYTTTSGRPNGTWNSQMGYGLVDAFEAVKLAQHYGCPENINIVTPITASSIYQASNQITASSSIADSLLVEFKANSIKLTTGFSVKNGIFKASLSPCSSDSSTMTNEFENILYESFSDMNSLRFAESFDAAISKVSTVNDEARLDQNIPNPLRGGCVIKYFVPQNSTEANIKIYDLVGQLIKDIPLSNGEGDIQIQSSNLSKGVYTYSLIVNGKLIDTKKMTVIE